MMIAELKDRSQLTIPKTVVKEMGLKTGDQFEIVVDSGEIRLVPVVVYTKAKIEKLEALAAQALSQSSSEESKTFSDPQKLIEFLHEDA